MAHSDIFIGGGGCFSPLLALLNKDGVVILPPIDHIYYSGLTNVVNGFSLMEGNLSELDKMLCKQKLYTTRKLKC